MELEKKERPKRKRTQSMRRDGIERSRTERVHFRRSIVCYIQALDLRKSWYSVRFNFSAVSVIAKTPHTSLPKARKTADKWSEVLRRIKR